jgi:cytochrome c
MTFAGLSSSEDRANVIAYMNAQGSNLPFPAAPAAPAEGEAAAPAAEGEAAAPAAEGAAPAAPPPAPAG